MLSTEQALVLLTLLVVALYFWNLIQQVKHGDLVQDVDDNRDETTDALKNLEEFLQTWFDALSQYREEVKQRLNEEDAQEILKQIAELQEGVVRIDSNYRSLKGTVARMHRKDPADLVAANDDDAGPTPGSELDAQARKKQLRDEAKSKGYL